MKKLIFLALVVGILADPAAAADKYLDTNSNTAGSGVVSATTYTWDTSGVRWTTDSTGSSATTTFASGDSAIFSAGTDAAGLSYTLTVPSALTIGNLTVEEGTVTKAGSGALNLQNITVSNNAGFFINSALSLTTTAGTTATLNGGTIGNSNTTSGSSFLGSSTANTNMGIVLGTGGGHVSANGGSTAIVTIYTGLISGTGPLSVDGNGTFRLTTTAATYSGDTIVNGRLQISTTANVIPNATDMTINAGGSFDVQASDTIGSLTGAGNITSAASPTLTIGGSTSPAAYTGAMSGNMSLTKSGAGTLTLGGTNIYTGATSVTGGTLQMNTAGAVPSGTALTLGAGTISNATGGLKTFTGATTLTGNGTLLENSAAENYTFSGNFTNSGGNRVLTTGNGAGTAGGNVTLSGNVFLSNTAGTGRTLIFAGGGTTASPSNPNYIVSGTVSDFNGAGTAGSIQVGNGTTATQARLTLSGPNTHTGATNVSTASLLNIGSAGALGSSTLTATGSGSFDNVTGSALTLSNNINLSGGSLTFVGSNDLTMGNVAMAGANRTITTTAKTLTVNNITEDVANRNFTKAGAGTLVMQGTASNSGAVNVNGGTMVVPVGANISAASAVNVSNSGTILTLNGTISVASPVTVNAGATLNGSGSIAGSVTSSGTISPGNSPGVITIGGNLSLLAGSYKYEIDSTPVATADLTNVTGSLSIASGAVTLAASDLGSSVLAMGTKFTLINYGGTWNGGTFIGLPNYYPNLVIGSNRYMIRYDDTTGGSNFGGGSVGPGSAFVTITAVPEASAFLTIGLGGIFAIAAVWIGRRMGVNVLKA
jgi:fibronectin-binding autotransporter adhesin